MYFQYKEVYGLRGGGGGFSLTMERAGGCQIFVKHLEG